MMRNDAGEFSQGNESDANPPIDRIGTSFGVIGLEVVVDHLWPACAPRWLATGNRLPTGRSSAAAARNLRVDRGVR